MHQTQTSFMTGILRGTSFTLIVLLGLTLMIYRPSPRVKNVEILPRSDGPPRLQQKPRPGLVTHPVTLVTAYYPFKTGVKHSLAEYDTWMSIFFPSVETPIIAFLPPGTVVENVKKMRGELPLTIKAMRLWDMEPNTKFRKAFEGHQFDIDPEKSKHSPLLYAIWNSKSWMLRMAAEENLYNSTYFLWVDAGAWRGRQFASWPDVGKLDDLYSIPTHSSRMLLSSPHVMTTNNYGFQAGTWYIQGGFFGGTQTAIAWWSDEYYRLLQEWTERGRFAGKDQELMIDISLRYSHRTIVIRSSEGKHGNPWFFFQSFLARRADLNGTEQSDYRMNTSHILSSPLISCKYSQL